MSTTVELGKATAEIARLRAGIEALANEHERRADAVAITYQDAEKRARATGPTRHLVRELRALLDES